MERTISIFCKPDIPGIVCIREGVYPPGWQHPSHAHRFGQILLVRGGQATVDIVDTRVRLDPGSVLAIPAGHEHAWSVTGRQPLRFFDVSLAMDVDGGRFWQALQYHGSGRELLQVADAHAAMIAADALEVSIQSTDVGRDYAIHGHVLQLMAAVLSAMAHSEHDSLDVVQRVETEIAVRYAEPLTLEQLAGWVGIGPKQLCRLFRRAGRDSPMACVVGHRLRASCQLLAETTLPIQRIAAQCGFADPQYFSRAFRRQYGSSPRHYRQEMAGE